MDYDEALADLECCCGCLCCGLCSCMCNLIWSLTLIIGIFVFFLWLIVHPSSVKFSVTDASLTQFEFSHNNTLNYNLTLNIMIRNPNRAVGIYYDSIETNAFYKGFRFSSETLGALFQHRKNTSILRPVFEGEQLIPLSSDQISEFKKEKKDGVYGIDLKIFLNVRFKSGSFKTGKAEPKVRCDLKVPLISGDSSSFVNGFQVTDCDWDYKWRLFS